ncbi:hypothetical protein AVEN_191295-1 [Araneus ventricosus]|uniref:Uncharacterized protein n=1 Tax=Araneus ventricosus TaxID=182803 RepID=A0A4Y2W9M0_ARAVE|nr:hypothetical protein AVEN_191295-1 [Araneus ventricosus]
MIHIIAGDKKGYLLSTKVEDVSDASIQLSRNYYFVPFSKNQRKKQFSCTPDGNTVDSSENNTRDSEATDNTDLQTDASSGSKKEKKYGFSFFG